MAYPRRVQAFEITICDRDATWPRRWQNNVGRPEIQGFFEALAGRRAKKDVFITTSAFTREARD